MILFGLGAVVCVVVGLVLIGAGSSSVSGRRRWWLAVAGVVVAGLPFLVLWAFLAGQPRPLQPDAPTQAGLRVDDGDLAVWTGAEPCEDVGRLFVKFRTSEPRVSDELRLDSDVGGARLGPFWVQELQEDPPEPLEIEQRLPASFDLADYETVTMIGLWGGSVPLEPVVAASADHPGEYWFGEDLGWMTASEAAERDGEDFYSPCATDMTFE
ncbi:hypothetical protein [Aeromicrobium sp. CTD01-1L150]|uniref:hypothetical protein n=1 Tax=Aeromicrobium sp. CTD01-1L150 TaxID=3341830 RepID=UPI0035C049B8